MNSFTILLYIHVFLVSRNKKWQFLEKLKNGNSSIWNVTHRHLNELNPFRIFKKFGRNAVYLLNRITLYGRDVGDVMINPLSENNRSVAAPENLFLMAANGERIVFYRK